MAGNSAYDSVTHFAIVGSRKTASHLAAHKTDERFHLRLHVRHLVPHIQNDFDAGEIDAQFARQVKNHFQALKIRIGVKPGIPLRARWLEQSYSLIQTQGLRVKLVQLGDGADHVARFSFLFCAASHSRLLAKLHSSARKNLPARIFRLNLAEFFQQIAHTFIFGFRHYHLNFDNLISAFPGMPRRRSAFFTQPQFLTAVSAGWNADLRAAINRRHFHLRAERGFRNRNRYDGKKIIATPLEEWMRFDSHHDVEVAWRAAMQPRVAAASHSHARTRLRARRDAHVECFHTRDAAFTAAIAAHRSQFSRSAATRAGDLKAHLST